MENLQNEYSIVFSNVQKAYGSNVVINDLNLNIRKGERLILLGPSGCGKTTTLRMIAGFEEITKGELYMDGRVVNDIAPGERNIAMVFQSYALFPHLSVWDNITFGLQLQKLPQAEMEKRARMAMEILHLEGYENKKTHELSGGQKQRVALCRALVKQSPYFLLDEPLSNLDAKLRQKARTELVKIHEMFKPTMVYVTHDQIEAMTVAHRIAVMNQGKIQQIDTPENIYHHPANTFVATFIGSPAMNFLPVWVEWRDERVCLEFGSSRLYVNRMCASRLIEGGYMGRRVYLGIRPEDFHETGPGENALLFEVEIREMLGAEQLLYGNSGRNELCVRMKPEFKAEPGSTVTVFVDMDRIKLFDMETEDNILYL